MAQSSSQDVATAHAQRVGGQYDEAHALYRQALEADESAAEAWWGLGLTLMNMGEFDESISSLEKAVAIEPASQRYLLDLGKHLAMLGMYEEAKPVFERILELNDTSREADEARNQLRYC
jgi:tetratricopeptide (TPR) repeat protein